MKKCENCGHATLPVTNQEIDSVICGSRGESAWWWVPDSRDAQLVRGRLYYSARIHGAEITTSYSHGYLKVKVTA